MKRRFFFLLFLALISHHQLFSQAAIQTFNNAPFNNQTGLVQNVLLGNGVTAFNITFNGDTVAPGVQMGFFRDTSSTLGIGIDSGLVMTSGSIFNVNTPNNSGSAGQNIPLAIENDADLTTLAGVSTFDRCILEFDFIPTSDSVKFNYVFASEEYDEYACCSVNDAFGFFLSGPGITGTFSNNAVNLALIPGTTTPVSINTVNVGTAACAPANCANLDPAWASYNIYYNQNPPNSQIFQYDGYTNVLTARYQVNACDTYHIKLAIADGGDGVFDSGVFLEAKSFSSGQVEASAEPTWDSPPGDSNLYEGCGDVSLVFERFQGIDSANTAYFTIGGTADPSDYSNMPDSIEFPAGASSVSYAIQIVDDGVVEGPETIIIKIHPDPNAPVCVANDTFIVSFVINDRDPLLATVTQVEAYCVDDSLLIGAFTNSGTPFFKYNWQNNGDSVRQFYIDNPRKDTLFPVIITDACSQDTIVDTVAVTYYPLEAEIFTEPFYCGTDTFMINATPPGGSWVGEGFIDPNSGSFAPRSVLKPYQTDALIKISYILYQSEECIYTDTTEIQIYNFDETIFSLPKLCIGDEDPVDLNEHVYLDFGTFFSIPGNGELFLGDALDENTGLIDPTKLDPGLYDLRHVFNDTVCVTEFDTAILVSDPPKVSIVDFDSIFCTHNEDTVYFEASPDSGIWGGNAVTEGQSGSIVPNQVGAGTYALSYFYLDTNTTCSNEQVITISISQNPPRPRVLYEGPYCAGTRLDKLTADGLRTNRYRWYADEEADSLLLRGRTIDLGELTESVDVYATQINNDGCESYTTHQWVEVIPLPLPDFEADPWNGLELPLEVNFLNQTPEAIRYAWDFGDGFASNEEFPDPHVYNELGIYNVTLYAENEYCQNSITKTIVADARVKIDIPNVFTPNGDGMNDRWNPDWENIDQAEVTVFNRWGQTVYEFSDPTDSWDGGNQKDGVYFYLVRGIEHSLTAKPVQYSGDITLIRDR